MKYRGIKVLGILDTRIKHKGCKRVYQDYTFIFSGVDPVSKAKLGIGFLIDPTLAKGIVSVTHQNECSIVVTITIDGVNTAFIQVFWPM